MTRPMDRDVVRLQSEHDQDIEECLDWFRRNSNAAKMEIWDAIQRQPTSTIEDIILRFAQLGFVAAFLKAAERLQEQES